MLNRTMPGMRFAPQLSVFVGVFISLESGLFFFPGCVGSWLLHTGFSLVVASGGSSLVVVCRLPVAGLLQLQSTGSRHVGPEVVAHVLSSSMACGVFLDQGSNRCPPSCKVDS